MRAQNDDGPVLKPKKAPVRQPGVANVTLLVMCDLTCDWRLDGEPKGRIPAGESAKAKVDIGEHIIDAATEDGSDHVQILKEIKDSGQRIIKVELKTVREARLKSEQEHTGSKETLQQSASLEKTAQSQKSEAPALTPSTNVPEVEAPPRTGGNREQQTSPARRNITAGEDVPNQYQTGANAGGISSDIVTPAAKQAMVRVIFKERFALLTYLTVSCDGTQLVKKLANKRFIEVELPSGLHTFTVNDSHGFNHKGKLDVSLAPGEEIALRAELKATQGRGWWILDITPQEEAKEMLSDIRREEGLIVLRTPHQ
jgi:hypothetical protein